MKIDPKLITYHYYESLLFSSFQLFSVFTFPIFFTKLFGGCDKQLRRVYVNAITTRKFC